MNLLTALWDRLTGRAAARQLLADFQATFPGRCPLCSHHRYGVIHGHAKPGTRPPPHDCPEVPS